MLGRSRSWPAPAEDETCDEGDGDKRERFDLFGDLACELDAEIGFLRPRFLQNVENRRERVILLRHDDP